MIKSEARFNNAHGVHLESSTFIVYIPSKIVIETNTPPGQADPGGVVIYIHKAVMLDFLVAIADMSGL